MTPEPLKALKLHTVKSACTRQADSVGTDSPSSRANGDETK